ncbi:MAG: L-2-amino-thiazoline-4-carboxylic acid hydrolase [Ignavibacteriaceae bacterium]|jgi:hypothetical protein
MKILFRKLAAFIILAPGLTGVYFLSLLVGKEKAIKLYGPLFTFITLPFAGYWVPKIKSASDFGDFSKRTKKKFWLWKLFFDFSIVQDKNDVFKLNVTYCPICDVIKTFGLSDLTPFVCEADWRVAKENENKWLFKREHQLATGDSFCDHTYLKKIENS